jgi:hypothetical protein
MQEEKLKLSDQEKDLLCNPTKYLKKRSSIAINNKNQIPNIINLEDFNDEKYEKMQIDKTETDSQLNLYCKDTKNTKITLKNFSTDLSNVGNIFYSIRFSSIPQAADVQQEEEQSIFINNEELSYSIIFDNIVISFSAPNLFFIDGIIFDNDKIQLKISIPDQDFYALYQYYTNIYLTISVVYTTISGDKNASDELKNFYKKLYDEYNNNGQVTDNVRKIIFDYINQELTFEKRTITKNYSNEFKLNSLIKYILIKDGAFNIKFYNDLNYIIPIKEDILFENKETGQKYYKNLCIAYFVNNGLLVAPNSYKSSDTDNYTDSFYVLYPCNYYFLYIKASMEDIKQLSDIKMTNLYLLCTINFIPKFIENNNNIDIALDSEDSSKCHFYYKNKEITDFDILDSFYCLKYVNSNKNNIFYKINNIEFKCREFYNDDLSKLKKISFKTFYKKTFFTEYEKYEKQFYSFLPDFDIYIYDNDTEPEFSYSLDDLANKYARVLNINNFTLFNKEDDEDKNYYIYDTTNYGYKYIFIDINDNFVINNNIINNTEDKLANHFTIKKNNDDNYSIKLIDYDSENDKYSITDLAVNKTGKIINSVFDNVYVCSENPILNISTSKDFIQSFLTFNPFQYNGSSYFLNSVGSIYFDSTMYEFYKEVFIFFSSQNTEEQYISFDFNNNKTLKYNNYNFKITENKQLKITDNDTSPTTTYIVNESTTTVTIGSVIKCSKSIENIFTISKDESSKLIIIDLENQKIKFYLKNGIALDLSDTIANGHLSTYNVYDTTSELPSTSLLYYENSDFDGEKLYMQYYADNIDQTISKCITYNDEKLIIKDLDNKNCINVKEDDNTYNIDYSEVLSSSKINNIKLTENTVKFSYLNEKYENIDIPIFLQIYDDNGIKKYKFCIKDEKTENIATITTDMTDYTYNEGYLKKTCDCASGTCNCQQISYTVVDNKYTTYYQCLSELTCTNTKCNCALNCVPKMKILYKNDYDIVAISNNRILKLADETNTYCFYYYSIDNINDITKINYFYYLTLNNDKTKYEMTLYNKINNFYDNSSNNFIRFVSSYNYFNIESEVIEKALSARDPLYFKYYKVDFPLKICNSLTVEKYNFKNYLDKIKNNSKYDKNDKNLISIKLESYKKNNKLKKFLVYDINKLNYKMCNHKYKINVTTSEEEPEGNIISESYNNLTLSDYYIESKLDEDYEIKKTKIIISKKNKKNVVNIDNAILSCCKRII